MTVRTHASESADSRNARTDAEERPRRRVPGFTLERSAEDEADAVLEVRDRARAGGVRARQSERGASELLRLEELPRHIPLSGHVGERYFAAPGAARANHAHACLSGESPEQGTSHPETQHAHRCR